MTRRLVLSLLALLPVAASAEPDMFATVTNRTVRFENRGTLEGFTGANVISKVTESTAEDHDGNGKSLRCFMDGKQPDTPKGGCHAEVHLKTFPDGTAVGPGLDFTRFTSHWVKLDTNINALDVGIWQLKNHDGPKQWRHLVGLWREAQGNGDELNFEMNRNGPDYNAYASLKRDGIPPLNGGEWRRIEVAGRFTSSTNGWVQIRIDGKPLTWYADHEGKERLGTVWRGATLPDLPGAMWQIQVGGYGFFKGGAITESTAYVDDFKIETAP